MLIGGGVECVILNPGEGNLTKSGFLSVYQTAKLNEVGYNLAEGTYLSSIQTLLKWGPRAQLLTWLDEV